MDENTIKQSIDDEVTIPKTEPQHVVNDVVKDVVKERHHRAAWRPERRLLGSTN